MPVQLDAAAAAPFAEALEHYLCDLLHARVRLSASGAGASLPAFVGRMYRLYDGRIAGQRCIFLVAMGDHATPAQVAKHVGLVRASVDAVVVFAVQSLSAHDRARLIAQGIPFVVPDNQLYLPDLAMDLRERFHAPRQRQRAQLSPAAQATLFHYLLRLDEAATTPSRIASRLRCAAMSVGRAFDDLAAAGLAKTERKGKERHIRFKAQGRALLEAARGLLRSPVRSVRFMRGGQGSNVLKRAGESALAGLTDLSPPALDAFAVPAADWKNIAEHCGFVAVSRSQADCIIETWGYDPAGLSAADTVDPLSLYAQFHDHSDERVALAADSLLEQIPW